MNVNFSNIGAGTGIFGTGQKIEGQPAKIARQDLRLSDSQAFDVLMGSEPVADVPAGELVRDDGLGRLVLSAFNLPPPPMPEFVS